MLLNGGAMLVGEEYRYAAIAQWPTVPREEGHFSPGQYVACRIDEDYISGRLIEVCSKHPSILKVCMHQGRNACDAFSLGCEDSGCSFRLLTTADNSAVLGLQDLDPFVVKELVSLGQHPLHGIIDSRKADELLNLIMKLETRQKKR